MEHLGNCWVYYRPGEVASEKITAVEGLHIFPEKDYPDNVTSTDRLGTFKYSITEEMQGYVARFVNSETQGLVVWFENSEEEAKQTVISQYEIFKQKLIDKP